MKRVIFSAAACALLGLSAAGCSAPETREAESVVGPGTGWARVPVIRSVRRAQASLVFTGEAEPGARVVLRDDAAVAYAAAADDRGRFEIRLVPPARPLLLRPETQTGQDAAPSPDRLLILGAGAGPVAMLRAGGPTRRLDDAPVLGAIDSDGFSLTASGRAEPGGIVEVEAGGEAVRARADAAGRWSVMLGPVGAGQPVRVNGAAFVWPGPGAPGGDLEAERIQTGWRVGWSGPAGARQWTWLPAAAP